MTDYDLHGPWFGNAMHEPRPSRLRDLLPTKGWAFVSLAISAGAAFGLWWVA